MNRRGLLLGLFAAPIAAALPKVAVATVSEGVTRYVHTHYGLGFTITHDDYTAIANGAMVYQERLFRDTMEANLAERLFADYQPADLTRR